MKSVPLPTLESYSYSDAKKFSELLDLQLGFNVEQIEKEIQKSSPHTPWAGLDPQALQTPYPEIRLILSLLHLQPDQTIVDLGAGYGRMGLVIAEFHPDLNFIGYEISPERVKEGRRILPHSERISLLQQDISRSDFVVPDVGTYFIYDFGDLESIVRVIEQLKLISKKHPIRVVGRGRRTRDHIERHEPWLSQVNPPRHCGNFSIYQS